MDSHLLWLFGFLVPPLLVLVNHFFALEDSGARWIRRIIDRRFGEGAASVFWRRLRPLWLVSAGMMAPGVFGAAAGRSDSLCSFLDAVRRRRVRRTRGEML